MCRIAAFPPFFPKQDAVAILRNMLRGNTDGTGMACVRDGKFYIKKWPKSLHFATRKTNFLECMPHDGWVIAHLRAASHGGNLRRNTHPFVVGDRAVIHNGIWSDYGIVKALYSSMGRKFKGETDTEVGAAYFDSVGPRTFAREITGGGVFMALNRDGSLEIAKTSGDLVVTKRASGAVLIASELDNSVYPDNQETVDGYIRFNADGTYDRHIEKETVYQWAGSVASNPNANKMVKSFKQLNNTVGATVKSYLSNSFKTVEQLRAGCDSEAGCSPTNVVVPAQNKHQTVVRSAGPMPGIGMSSMFFGDRGQWD